MKKYFENEENRSKPAVTIKKCIEKYGKIIGEQKYKE